MKKTVILSLLIVLFAAAGCSKADKSRVLVTVDGHKITEAQAKFFISMLPQQQQAYYASPQGYQNLLDRLVETTLLTEYAKSKGIDKKPQVKMLEKNMKSQILLQELYTEIKNSSGEISDSEASAYFAKHKKEFDLSPTADISILRAKTLSAAKKLKAQAKDKVAFMNLSSKLKGDTDFWVGSIPGIKKGTLQPELDNYIFSAKSGTISPVIKSSGGYVIVLVDKLKRAGDLTFKDFKPQISDRVNSSNMSVTMQNLIDKLKAKARIKYNFK